MAEVAHPVLSAYQPCRNHKDMNDLQSGSLKKIEREGEKLCKSEKMKKTAARTELESDRIEKKSQTCWCC